MLTWKTNKPPESTVCLTVILEFG